MSFLFLFLGCYKIKTVFSHVQDRIRCDGCQIVLCRPTGGKGKLSDGKLTNYTCFKHLGFVVQFVLFF